MESVITKENEQGVMHIINCAGFTLYTIFTNTGYYRGGKIYFADKIARVLKGSCVLTEQIDGVDVTTLIRPSDGERSILSGVPHVFYFPEDCLMTEIFPEGTRSEDYQKYRNLKR